MGWFSSLFAVDKAAENVLDKDNGLLSQFGGWVGNMQFTEQEVAESNKEVMKIAIDRIKAMEPFKVMQRIMVTIIMAEWAIIVNCALVCIMNNWDEKFAKLMTFATSEFAWMPVVGAVGLYLFGGVIPTRKGA